ncbi:MAG: hypothetical protein KBT03_07125 [Bacteroidales bacterium]|nr:hypothetical protein [Candidatus Scybalousia scybalohippi]
MALEDYSVTRTRVILQNIPSYTTYLSIQGLQIILEVGYNTRNSKRFIALRTVNDDILLQRTFIGSLDRVYCNINTEIYGITLSLVLEPKNTNFQSEDYLNWKDDYWLTFISNDIEYDETISELQLDLHVGGRA